MALREYRFGDRIPDLADDEGLSFANKAPAARGTIPKFILVKQ
jgi:hypothetical protein